MPSRTPDHPPPPPVVQRLRLRYAKRGRLRFSSHRDFQRALERALRRAGVPVAFSAGFSPHPKISYVGAAPTGVASEAEYVEIGVADQVDPAAVRAALDEALPPGLDVLEVVVATSGSLAERIEASHWEMRLPGVTVEEAETSVARFLAQESVPVERLTTKGRRQLDARAAVIGAAVRVAEGGDGPCAIIHLVVRHLTPAVRPDDIVVGLRDVAGLTLAVTPLVTRRAQGLLDADGRLADPLAPDRPTPTYLPGGPDSSEPHDVGARA